MLDPGSLAIEAARAAIGEMQVASQRVERLVHGRAETCEGLVAALQRWPSFAVADPWAVEAPLPAGAASPEVQTAARRATPWGEAPRPAASQSTAKALSAAPPRSRPGALAQMDDNSRVQWTSRRGSPAADSSFEPPVEGARRAATVTSITAAAAPASALAALVTQAIARHVPQPGPQGRPDNDAQGTTWRKPLPGETVDSSPIESPPRAARTTSGESHAPLQAVDLPTRAALETLARSDTHNPPSTALALAADMLRRLLPEASSAGAETSTLPRVVAPRAPSRLLAAPRVGTASAPPGPRPATPANAPPDEDNEAAAESVSRLLADQAWLRGADFT